MEDGALWIAYETAGCQRQKDAAARRIVEAHMGFLQWYAKTTAFPYWPDHIREEYLSELVIVCLVRIPSYNRKRFGHEGRTASFPTYLKPYLQGVRWEIAARESPIPVGRDTRRMRANAHRFIRDEEQAGRDASWEDVAEAVGKAHGRKLSPKRIERLTNTPTVVSGDALVGDGEQTLWDIETPLTESPEDILVLKDEAENRGAQIRQALASLSPQETLIVEHRLTCNPKKKTSLKTLAGLLNVPQSQVSRMEKALIARLRVLLA